MRFTIGLEYKVNNPSDKHHGKTGQLYRIRSDAELSDGDGNEWDKYWLTFPDMPDDVAGYGFEASELEAV